MRIISKLEQLQIIYYLDLFFLTSLSLGQYRNLYIQVFMFSNSQYIRFGMVLFVPISSNISLLKNHTGVVCCFQTCPQDDIHIDTTKMMVAMTSQMSYGPAIGNYCPICYNCIVMYFLFSQVKLVNKLQSKLFLI